MSTKLKYEERLFCREYLQTHSVRGASKAVGISPLTGAKWMQKQAIQDYIEEEFQKYNTRNMIDIDKVLQEIARIIQSDITDYFENVGGSFLTFKDFSKLTPEQTRCIQSIKETISPTGEARFEIKLYDKTRVIDIAARHLGMIVDKLQLLQAEAKDELGGPRVKVLGSPEKPATLAEWEQQNIEAAKIRAQLKEGGGGG